MSCCLYGVAFEPNDLRSCGSWGAGGESASAICGSGLFVGAIACNFAEGWRSLVVHRSVWVLGELG